MTISQHGNPPRSQPSARRHLRTGRNCPTNRSHLCWDGPASPVTISHQILVK
jgi:hypothetical protein